ncbi:PspA/IM30 family protein [Halalkalibacter alkalisediminis]|uniref:PspA/IM30 family protein n=1 Tax=Halalkalibacter alkalisediminis TaxID=935616 RepID=A0ABV6NNU3_9BACI|nr:PspA/IM30 family protein [Halalkalibacter alkalisediminis]
MVMKRISSIIKAYVYEGLEKLEDPMLMAKQCMRDIQGEMDQLEETIKKQETHEKKLVHQLAEAKKLFLRREEQARMTIQAGEDELARKILVSKKRVWERMTQYEQLINKTREDLKEQKEELENSQIKYEQIKERNVDVRLEKKARNQMERFEESEQYKTSSKHEDEWDQKKQDVDIENELNLLKAKIQS